MVLLLFRVDFLDQINFLIVFLSYLKISSHIFIGNLLRTTAANKAKGTRTCMGFSRYGVSPTD